jgi:Flp pilus assembly protein TadD
MILASAVVTLLAVQQAAVPPAKSDDEVQFGVEAARRGLWTEARFRFERAVALTPENPKALNDLAIALEQQGEFQKAREAYDKALKLRPKDDQIQQNFDLFREADEKRNRKASSNKKAAATPAPTSAATPAATPAPPGPSPATP